MVLFCAFAMPFAMPPDAKFLVRLAWGSCFWNVDAATRERVVELRRGKRRRRVKIEGDSLAVFIVQWDYAVLCLFVAIEVND
jgi:hypothetical protein